jgi:hypothetical protein
MCIFIIKKDKNLLPLQLNPESLSWAIMRTEFGVKAIALPLFFAKTVFVSWLVSLSKSVALSVREIVKHLLSGYTSRQ